MKIGIVGGGVSGLAAAVTAARANRTADIFVLEHKDILGKKILSTGNGRCNLTNSHMDVSCYRSEDPAFVEAVLKHFKTQEALDFYQSLGLLVKDREGYYYPRSLQASSVREAFCMALQRLNVKVYTDVHVTGIKQSEDGFVIQTKGNHNQNRSQDSNQSSGQGKEQYKADKIILATGGKASPVLGSDGSGYALARSLGHTIIPVVPALVQLKVKDHPLAATSGVRTDAKVSVLVDGQIKAEDTGELQITDYGISGIPVLQISRFAAKGLYEKKKVSVSIDFLPDMEEDEACTLFEYKFAENKEQRVDAVLTGVFPKKLSPALLGLASIRKKTPAGMLKAEQIKSFVKCCKRTSLIIEATNGFESAQVCAGGVDTTGINPATMESRRTKGLYITGELVDVDGMCGGYNISFFTGTGCIAGAHAAGNSTAE